MKILSVALIVALISVCGASRVHADLYANGFETDIAGWDAFGPGYDPARVASGTNGITSASGSFHAESSASGSAGNWGGYNFGAGNNVPTAFQEYTTSVDIYLSVARTFADNDKRFDFDSAISNSAGGFQRDFIFNGGFYDELDLTGPGAGTDRFVFSASNNSQPGSAFAKNPGRDPVAISATGWYTFEHHFTNNAGVLQADLSIYDSTNALVHSWTLSDPADLIALVGGNRYAWFTDNDFSVLAFDNSQLSLAAVPETSAFLFGGVACVAGGAGLVIRRRRSA